MNSIEMTIRTTPEIARKIADLLANEGASAPPVATPQIPAPVITQPAPVQQPIQAAPTVPPVQAAAPTAAPAYTIAQLQAACAPLADAGKLPALQQLISAFGVASLSELPPARYGEFANGLRALGGVL